MAHKCIIEIFSEGRWHPCAEVSQEDDGKLGTEGKTRLVYLSDWDLDHLHDSGNTALSVHYPVILDSWRQEGWPAFLLDLMPSGAARRFWERRLGLPNNPTSDWELLLKGGGGPIGNLRVAQEDVPVSDYRAFGLEEILQKDEAFIEEAISRGAPISGTTGAGGDAPKFLITKDREGRWHPGGACPDAQVESEWIVKFLRGRSPEDEVILQGEALLYPMAERLGLRGGFAPQWRDGSLLIPRFDVFRAGDMIRLGYESLASMLHHQRFGQEDSHERALEVIERFCTHGDREMVEYVMRDHFDQIIGNPDNHGRNTAILKFPGGRIELSPIFDKAPMQLDRQLIARTFRWKSTPMKKGFVDHHELCGVQGWDEGLCAQGLHSFVEGLKTLDFQTLPMDRWREHVERRREDFLELYG